MARDGWTHHLLQDGPVTCGRQWQTPVILSHVRPLAVPPTSQSHATRIKIRKNWTHSQMNNTKRDILSLDNWIPYQSLYCRFKNLQHSENHGKTRNIIEHIENKRLGIVYSTYQPAMFFKEMWWCKWKPKEKMGLTMDKNGKKLWTC